VEKRGRGVIISSPVYFIFWRNSIGGVQIMTKLKVKETFRYEGEEYEEGNVIDLPESVANSVEEKGYGDIMDGESPEIEVEEEEEVETDDEGFPEVESGPGDLEEDPWDKLDQRREESTSLPPKWNPSQDDPSEPDPNPLKGTIVNRGNGPNGDFIVVEEKDSETRHTIWEHTALRPLIYSAKVKDRVSIKFEGEDTNPAGQKYLNYSAAALKPDGSARILQEPEEN
jgi:hypothetical protein